MRIRLSLPAEWVERFSSPRFSEIVVHQGSTQDPELLLRIRWELPMPAGFMSWIEEAMRYELPAGCHLRQIALERRQSTVGWPVSVARYAVLDGGGRQVEQRVGVFYRLLDHAAEAVLLSRSPERLQALGPEIMRVLLAGDADWTQEQAPSLFHLRSEGMTLPELMPGPDEGMRPDQAPASPPGGAPPGAGSICIQRALPHCRQR